jgi:uncharacterized membrane protein
MSKEEGGLRYSPAMIALVALLIALTTVFTRVITIPIPATQGYFNLSDVAITFSALVFGPWVGAIAGGVGTALADLSTGAYAIWAPVSLVAHGLEGFVIGWLARGRPSTSRIILAWFVGSTVMVLCYLAGGALIKGLPAALVEVPFNAFQALVGGVVGIPLALAVRRAYPAVDQLGRRRTWHE